ncbi:O-antigen ligase family protein [Aeromonas allosaccharophila]|uniref:O-antigen ligase family protein n=1 Tax=Aeromonas allosaccharophila TaxID=656 RepID=UPI003D1D5037
MFKESVLRDCLGISVFLFTILTSGTVLNVINLPLSYFLGISFLIFCLFIAFFFNISLPIKKSKVIFIIVPFILFSLMLLPGVIFNESFSGYTGLISRFLILSVLFIFIMQSSSNVTRYLEISLWLVILHALVGWFFSLLSFINYSYLTNGSYETSTFFYVFFKWVSFDFLGFTVYRNMGLFWEPGLLQIYSNLLLFLLLMRKCNWKKLCIPIFITITTLSTTGFIVMTVLILRFSNFFRMDRFLPFKILFTSVVVFCTFLVTYDKFLGEGVGSSSARLFDLYNGLAIIKNNIWFGIGYDDNVYLQFLENGNTASIAIDGVDDVRGNTNSFLKIFFVFGVPLGIIFIFIFARNACFSSANILFGFFIIVVSATEPVIFMNFFLFLFIISVFSCFNKSKDCSASLFQVRNRTLFN